ncbi:MAG: hypothetical protein ACE5HP_12545 [Gemmatimonadota bacterium]
MRRYLGIGLGLTLGLGLGLAAPSQAAAQDSESPPVLQISWFQCDWNEVGTVLAEADSMNLPIWKELEEEGLVRSAGTLTHWMADEWNVAFYMVVDDIPAYLKAFQEAQRRFNERYPDYDIEAATDRCPVHKDAFYHFGPRTGADDEEEAEGEDEGG